MNFPEQFFSLLSYEVHGCMVHFLASTWQKQVKTSQHVEGNVISWILQQLSELQYTFAVRNKIIIWYYKLLILFSVDQELKFLSEVGHVPPLTTSEKSFGWQQSRGSLEIPPTYDQASCACGNQCSVLGLAELNCTEWSTSNVDSII